ncbi:MAG: UDP-N-acetylmuramoyl-L-alanyl-D-glutamate--2,6-diaminopimelate ligase [Christensenellales bacterium]
MLLSNLLENVEVESVNGSVDIAVQNVAFDTKDVVQGSVFVCLKGHTTDGHLFVDIALAKGAVAIVCGREVYAGETTVVKVKDTRIALAVMASNFFGNPCKRLKIIGVIGTNGKSTTAYLIHKMLSDNGVPCGLIGTMYVEYAGNREQADMTTPDPTNLHELFKKMLDSGCKWVVMEISAHAIALQKLYGVFVDTAIFTNLSQDHLDFFENLNNYKICKKSFFNASNVGCALVNVDDECGREIIKECNAPVLTYGLDNPADCFAIDYEPSVDGCRYVVNMLDEILPVYTHLYGKFNVYNVLAATLAVKMSGIDNASIVASLANITPPAGRFNVFHSMGRTYIIDFAHTPDGLYNVLKESRKLTDQRLIVVFGCGGDRDVSKRPQMGKIASEMADVAVVTSDNPRTESRKSIAQDIIAGMCGKAKLFVELDRGKAIELAKDLSGQGDVVLIAGKGSEDYIDEMGVKKPYSDMAQLVRINAIAIQ